MKRPQSPPQLDKLYAAASRDGRLRDLFPSSQTSDQPGRYLHWDRLRRLAPPGGLSHEDWWLATKLGRLPQYRPIPLSAVDGTAFCYMLPEPITEQLHKIDLSIGGSIGMPDAIVNPEMRDRYLVRSLYEEAITSSQLEGAATTREVAKEMLRTGTRPRDHGEKMILNNYLAMQEIRKLKDEPFTADLILHLHKLVTSDTLPDPADAGRLRRGDRPIDVGDLYGEVFHKPPPADQLEDRMDAMCDFANGNTPKGFVHPVLRSIMLHFWLAYDHPFVDGNGRTARSLFYWSMLRHGYWLSEFISVSEIIRKGPAKYGRAFLCTETDDNDLTYFILYHIDVIRRAIAQLDDYVERKTRELRLLEQRLRALVTLNHRQQVLVSHALRHPDCFYTIESHRHSHDVVYETARSDLHGLAKRGLLKGVKVGRQWRFTPMPDIEEKLRGP